MPLGPGAGGPQAGEGSWPARGRDRPRPRGLGVPRPEGGGARRGCSGPRGGGLAGALGQRPRQRPGFAARLGGPDRTLYAALFAAGLAWALHAGVDWDWQMPAVTLWVFALGGAALAAPARAPRIRFSPPLALPAAIGAALTLGHGVSRSALGAPPTPGRRRVNQIGDRTRAGRWAEFLRAPPRPSRRQGDSAEPFSGVSNADPHSRGRSRRRT